MTADKGTAPKAAFPKLSLEDALLAPEALQKNGGQPLSAIDMATAVNRSPGSSAIRTLGSASSAYGLTGGSYHTTFTMKDGGRKIVEPTSPGEKAQALVAAALRPPTFKAIFDYYKGKKFPEQQFFINTVTREFGVDPKQAEKCVEIFTANMAFAKLIKDTPGGAWLVADPSAGHEAIETVNEERLQRIRPKTVTTRQPRPMRRSRFPRLTHRQRNGQTESSLGTAGIRSRLIS